MLSACLVDGVKMNKNQKIVLAIVSLVFLGMLLFPPFHQYFYRNSHTRLMNGGYSFIFVPPNRGCFVNIGLLLIQMLVVAVIATIAWVMLQGKSQVNKGRVRGELGV